MPTFDWTSKAGTKYTLAMVDQLYPEIHQVALNLVHWVCVNIPASKDMKAAECYRTIVLPGAEVTKEPFKDVWLPSGAGQTGDASPKSTYGWVLFEQSKDFGPVSKTGQEFFQYGADFLSIIGGNATLAK